MMFNNEEIKLFKEEMLSLKAKFCYRCNERLKTSDDNYDEYYMIDDDILLCNKCQESYFIGTPF